MSKKRSVSEADKIIGKKLKKLRLLRNVTQGYLAGILNVSFQQFQKYERGVNRISAVNLHKLSRELNVPMTVFFEEDPIPGIELNPLTKTLLRRWKTLNEQQKKDLLNIMSLMRK